MKNILKKLNNFYKAIIKKLNNFRLTSFIASVVALVTGLTSVGLFCCYYFAGDVWETTHARVPSFMNLGISDPNNPSPYGEPVAGKMMGMVFFLSLVILLGLSIAVIYNALPFVKNKDKVTPRKNNLIFSVIAGGFGLITLVFSILAIVLEHPNTFVPYIITIPFSFLTMVANILLVVPLVKCVFYQPAVGTKLFANKEDVKKEAETK